MTCNDGRRRTSVQKGVSDCSGSAGIGLTRGVTFTTVVLKPRLATLEGGRARRRPATARSASQVPR